MGVLSREDLKELLRITETESRFVRPTRPLNAMVAGLSKPKKSPNPPPRNSHLCRQTGCANRCPMKKSTSPACVGFPFGRFTTFEPKNAPSRAYSSVRGAESGAACLAGVAAPAAGATAPGVVAGVPSKIGRAHV